MNYHEETHVILALVIVLFLIVIFCNTVLAQNGQSQNQTYSNVTISILDYDGNLLYEGSTYPKLEVYNTTGSLVKSLTCVKASCKIINISTGTYSFKVYWQQVEVAYVNNTLEEGENSIEIQCNVKKARIRAVDDADSKIPFVDVSLVGPSPGYDKSFVFNTGEDGEIKKFLPFGTYELSSATWQWGIEGKTLSINAVAQEDLEYTINAQNDYIKIQMNVSHSLTFAFYTIDNRELISPDAKVEIKFKYKGDWQKIFEDTLTHRNKVTLGPIPYGEYRIITYWSDKTILTKELIIDSNIYDQLEDDMLKLKVSMYKNLLLRFVNADEEPLKNMYVILMSPSGGNSSYVTDDTGSIRLGNITTGKYTARLRWLVGYADVDIDLSPEEVSGTIVEIPLSFYNVNLALKSRGSETLPENLQIIFRCNNYILLNETLDEEVKSYENTFENLYSEHPYYYYLDVSYMGYKLFSDRVIIEQKNIEISLDLYDLTITVLSKYNYTLPHAKLSLKYPKGESVLVETDETGKYTFKHLILGYGTYDLSVYWKNYLVNSFTLKEEDIAEGEIRLRVNVYDVYVKVYNVLHNGLKDTTIMVYLKNSTTRVPMGNATTDPTGLAKIRGIPLPSGYDIVISVDYKGRFKLKDIIIEQPEKTKEITIDVLVELFGIPLSPIETGAIFTVTVIGAAASYLFIRWYRFKETVTKMFAESRVQPEAPEYPPEYEIEERPEKRSFLSRIIKKIKDRIEELFGEGEKAEEEEYDIFG